ncbi:hypothetical protein WKR88_13060 [Trinickia caryophylli]|uniref:Scavenger mRNA decapping enzyme C-term binding n=1 Tax=Trinickia caryophylli TaxID=28094 RepID=A0A1X7H5F6_TRICW|nr:hypothetical protein [Trinickia caryophylli]PMS09589.1 hypothetical protein C0Z17_24110 [Trinickia caryophylli]TRX17278.1 hypothetical protein FNF07_02875 [Trinickia caryophylli]WQE11982.1 hypothetical protein U0034_00685 [Trinickia caryophylli]SMF79635.1 Scavenger mRNA decapping enzyme C-term binding [Trinickia caryophylli]
MKEIQALHRPAVVASDDLNIGHQQSIDVRAVRNVSDGWTPAGGSSIRRKLDAYGVDDNRPTLSRLNDGKYNVFIKKDKSGSPNLSQGAYVSKRGEDEYGSFKWLNPKGLTKYQTKEVAVVSFSSKAELEQLARTYAERPLPEFLVKVLNGEDCLDTNLYERSPRLADFVPPLSDSQHGYLIAPNTPYCGKSVLDTYVHAPETLKNSRDGVILCTYAIHPGIQSAFLEGRNHKSGLEKLDASTPTTQREIDNKTNVESLTSILSLKKEHLPQLEKLREETLRHLHDVYAVDESDSVRMFFHFPVAEKTATLHLHTWVNKGDHPLNEPRSFDLDTIIDHLRSGGDVDDLVLNRNGGSYFLPTSDSIKDISGIPFKGIRDNTLNLPL